MDLTFTVTVAIIQIAEVFSKSVCCLIVLKKSKEDREEEKCGSSYAFSCEIQRNGTA
jgi:hypothetical protein